MYTNTFKNELTTDQKHKLLFNACGILFYCRNGAKSTALKRTQTVQGSLLCFLFCLILFLTSQWTIFRLCRDGSSWVEPVLSYDYYVLLKDTTQWRRRGQKFERSRYSIAAHSTKSKMRGSREGAAEGPDPPPLKIGNLWGSLAILVQIPWKIKSYQASIPYSNHRPASVLLLGWRWPAFSGILIPHSIHLKKSVSELS